MKKFSYLLLLTILISSSINIFSKETTISDAPDEQTPTLEQEPFIEY